MYRPTDHRAPPTHKDAHDRMHTSPPALLVAHHAPQHPFLATNHPPLADGPRHGTHHAQTRRDGRALEIPGFPRRVLGQAGHGDVEAGEAREATEDEEGEEEAVERRAEAEGKGCGRRGYAEGNLPPKIKHIISPANLSPLFSLSGNHQNLELFSFCGKKGEMSGTYQIGQRIQLLAHQTALLPPPGHLAVHEIEEEPEGYEGEGEVYVTVGCRGAEAVAHGREDGHEAAEAWQIH